MTNIRDLLNEASADIDIGPADPVALVRQGLTKRRQAQGAILAAAIVVAAGIAVPVAVAGSSGSNEFSVGPTHTWATVRLYEVVDTRHPARHTRVVHVDNTRVEIQRQPTLVLTATAAAVKHGPSGWQVWLASPQGARFYELASQSSPPSFVGVLLGQAYRVEAVEVGRYHDAAVLPFASKQLATAAAERLAPLVTVPETVRLPPQCTPNVPNCRRFVHRMQRLLRRQHQNG